MPTPYQIQLGNLLYTTAAIDSNGGPYTWNNAGYAGVSVVPITVAGFTSVAFYKTTDGHTWTRQDQTNEPPSTKINAYADIFYPKAGGSVLYIADFDAPNAIPSTASLSLHSFDMATDTYSTLATGGPTAYNYKVNPQFLMVRRSTAQFVIMYQKLDGGGKHQTYYVTWSSGPGWGVETLISSGYANGDQAHPLMIGIDAADNVYFIWYSYSTGGGNGNIYANILSGSVLGATTLIIPQATVVNYIDPGNYNFNQGWNLQGKYLTGENKVVWALPYWDVVADPAIIPTLLIVDCASGTFSTVTVHSYALADSNEQDQFWIDFAPNSAETSLRVIWTRNILTEGNLLVTSDSTTTAGPWGAPANYYVEATSPPVPAQAADGTNSTSARYDSNGNFNVLVGLFSLQDGGSFQQAQFGMWTGTAPISIACPISPLTATVGVPYSSDAPIVTSDTPPDTFALLSGPAWMTIDSATGVVSGTPTFEGSVTYTIKVTDSLGNTATVSAPCPLTVGNPIPPPPFCIVPPATGIEVLALVNEPLENQGT